MKKTPNGRTYPRAKDIYINYENSDQRRRDAAIRHDENTKRTLKEFTSSPDIQGKQKIAKLVEGLIEDGDHIILDPSTTAGFIAKALKSKERLTVITNSIEVILELSDTSDWNIISSGGSLREGYLALVGPRAVEGLGAFNVEKAIISCKGLDMEKGITDGNELFSQAKQTMLKSAKQCILAVDHTKFDRIAFSKICDVHDIHVVVTDEKPSEQWLELFDRFGIACLYPQQPEESEKL